MINCSNIKFEVSKTTPNSYDIFKCNEKIAFAKIVPGRNFYIDPIVHLDIETTLYLQKRLREISGLSEENTKCYTE